MSAVVFLHAPPCETWRKRSVVGAAVLLMLLGTLQPATAGTPIEARTQSAAESRSHDAPHEPTAWALIGKVVNFGLLVGTLVYFLRAPFGHYLARRHAQIREDLATAARMTAEAGAQIAALDDKLKHLPEELDRLRAEGEQEIAAEGARIRREADADRERLLEQTRREIDVQLRLARRELVAHAADLAVQVARDRIRTQITQDDQRRLVDRYLEQVKHA
jgi:F-type H+-transporting ATPase subunit b